MKTLADYIARIGALVVLAVSLAACGSEAANPGLAPTATPQPGTSVPVPTAEPTVTPEPTPTSGGDMVVSEANVESVEIMILESFPVQVRVVAKGSHPDPCTTVKDVTKERDGNTFTVTITAQREQGASCIQVIDPFEETIPLDVAGLPAGTYTVTVNGISEQFTLDTDNVSP